MTFENLLISKTTCARKLVPSEGAVISLTLFKCITSPLALPLPHQLDVSEASHHNEAAYCCRVCIIFPS